jgi:hypothetical protein
MFGREREVTVSLTTISTALVIPLTSRGAGGREGEWTPELANPHKEICVLERIDTSLVVWGKVGVDFRPRARM